jgi:hypothetical protein
MPFGLTNAPASFQRFMNKIFADLLDISVVVYLDDILIYSEDPTKHAAAVRKVLRRLRLHGLFACADKCEFLVTKCKYLGFIMSPNGLRMDEKKIAAVRDWPVPRKIKEVQSFLGFANFYQRFIFGYSDIVVPLNALTRKNSPWNWNSECQRAFEHLKQSFTTKPVLTHWEPDSQLIVESDASNYAIAAVLSCVCSDGELRPIAYHSHTLQAAKLNYNTHDKELLAIHKAFKIWRHYLEGSSIPIICYTNHKNLEYFALSTLPRPRCSPANKHNGPNSYQPSTSLSPIVLVSMESNRTR